MHTFGLQPARTGLLALAALGALQGVASTPVQPPPVVPHGRPADFEWTALPEFGGQEAIIYRSADGRRVAAAFRESGRHTFTYPFDEFLVVTAGSVKVRVHGGASFELTRGDVAYFREGMTVDLDFSPDFEDVTMLVSDREVKWR